MEEPGRQPPIIIHAAAVFVVALAVRLTYAAQVSNCPLFQTPTMDARDYYELARQFARGYWLNPVGEPYFQPPLYSVVLAIWFKVAGTAVATAKNAQFVLGSLNCVLTLILGARMFGRRVGLIAGVAAALYAPMIYFDGELLTPTLQTFLNLAAILALVSARDNDSVWWSAVAGLLLGLSLIVRPDVLVFLVGSAIWTLLAFRRRRPGWQVWAPALVLTACAALPVIPVAARNMLVGKDRVLISSNGGINFYIGNNALYDQTVALRPGPDWDAMAKLALKKKPDAKPSEQSAYFYSKGFNYALGNPLAYAALLVKKTVICLTAVEGRRNHDLYFYRNYSSLYSILLFKTRLFAFPLGIVLPLAVIGLAKRWSGSGLLIWYLGAQLTAAVAFFPCARYRVTSIPVLLVFAACGAVELWKIGKEKAWRRSIPVLAAAVILLLIANGNVYDVDRRQDIIDADTHYYTAEVLAQRGDIEGAARECRLSIALNPHYKAARLNYSRMLCALGELDEAKRQIIECFKLDPSCPAAHAAIGHLLVREGKLPEAELHLEIAAKADPSFADALVRLAEQAYEKKDYAVAERALRALLAIDPEYSEAKRSLRVVLAARSKRKR